MIKVLERPTILLKEISINYQDTVEDNVADEYATDMGRYPYLQIGNLVIQTTDTSKIILYNDQFLPKIEVYFKDPTFKLIDPLFPIDDEIISLFIQSSSELLMPVRMDFKIIDFNVSKTDNDINYILTGLLNIDYLYFQEYYAIPDTSFNVLKELSKKSKLGFATNIDNTNDFMMWINVADTNLDFIQKVVDYSYRSDESFMLSYIDFYYNLNYVDIETALNEDISEMTGIFTSYLSKEQKDEPVSRLFLTDHPDKSNTNQFIEKYTVINESTKINLDIGYRKYVTYYDKNGNTRYEFIVESITSPGNKNVNAKGKIGEMSQIYKNSMEGKFLGTIDTDNVHSNYLYAKVQNEQNIDFLQKIRMKVVLSSVNFNLYRFQKVEIVLYKLKEIDNDEVTAEINPDNIEGGAGKDWDQKKINQRLSGEWLIIGINYTFNKVGGFSQEITLVRRELGFNENDYK